MSGGEIRVTAKPGLWWTMDWTMDWTVDWTVAQGGSRISAMAKNNSKEAPVAFYRTPHKLALIFQCI
jgi:hypothetical protein